MNKVELTPPQPGWHEEQNNAWCYYNTSIIDGDVFFLSIGSLTELPILVQLRVWSYFGSHLPQAPLQPLTQRLCNRLVSVWVLCNVHVFPVYVFGNSVCVCVCVCSVRIVIRGMLSVSCPSDSCWVSLAGGRDLAGTKHTHTHTVAPAILVRTHSDIMHSPAHYTNPHVMCESWDPLWFGKNTKNNFIFG